jgi:ABC-2 type transport system permease protein
MDNLKNHLNKFLTHRVYSASVCILALVLVIGVNLLTSQLPVDAVKLDTTSMGLHTLSDSTKEVVENIDEDIDIYLICQAGNENETILTMLERYADLSNHINFTTVDPAVNPDFVKNFTEESVANNTIIVSSAIRNRIIDYSSISTYTSFKGEDYVTNAIKYVTSDTLPVIYTLTGHGEKTDNDSLDEIFASSGVQLKELNLITESTMPEDIDCLFIYAPTEDITENEKETISSYLENGGSLMLVSDYNFSNLPNLASVMDYYGVYAPDGIVVEASTGMSLCGYPYYVLPEISSKSEITKTFSENSNYILIPIAQAIEKNDEIRDTVKITDLFTTSGNSYIVDDSTSADFSQAKEGPFSLGVSIEESFDDTDTKIVWLTSSYILDSDMDSLVGGTNTSMFINAVNYLCGNSDQISTTGKVLSTDTLTMSTSQSRNFKIVIIGIIPVLALAAGIAVRLKRRNR